MIHLDTHVLVWLSGGKGEHVPAAARRRLDLEGIVISPMVQLELTYLFEVGKITRPAGDVLTGLTPLGLTVSDAPFALVVSHALPLEWTRDPFDRLITAAALADDASLLTADEHIRANCSLAFWE